jgi:hypothetical protein
MPTIDEIFENMPAEASVTYEELVIDAESRKIYVPDAEAIFGVESDTQAERKHFRCPRYVGAGLDLAGCFLRVNFRNANGEVDAYLITDVAVDGEDITFSWELSKKVTAYKGEVQFVICAVMGAGLPEWNTTLAVGTVLEGLEPDSSTVEAETADVIAQLLAMVAAQSSAVEAVGAAQCDEVREVGENTTEEAKAAVEAKGAAVVASIPADYTALANTVDGLTRDRAAAIVCEAEGEDIQVKDSSADQFIGLRLFGESTQDGTPTPEAPVEIVSAKAPVVTVCGKNLLPYPYSDGESKEMNGITFSVREDGSVLVNGTATALAFFSFSPSSARLPLPAGWITTSAGIGYGPGIVQIQNDIYRDEVFIKAVQTATKGAATQEFTGSGLSLGASRIKVDAGVTVNNVVVYPILASSDTEPTYEKPKACRTLTLSTPDSLHGIPVTSGGNYTDANGQQWIADEVDLARGVYVSRFAVVELTGGESWSQSTGSSNIYEISQNNIAWRTICSHYPHASTEGTAGEYAVISNYTRNIRIKDTRFVNDVAGFKVWLVEQYEAGTPVKLLRETVEPIETPLSTEEIEAYKALLANKPTTTVLNDAGAWMALEYAADPKTYIDNKIKEAMNL